MPPKNKNKKFLAKQKELAEAKAKKDAEKAANEAAKNVNKKVLSIQHRRLRPLNNTLSRE